MNITANNTRIIKRLVIFALSILLIFTLTSCKRDEKDTPELYVDAINHNFDSKVYLIGDNIEFKYELEYTLVSTLDECDSNAEYKFVIINFETSEFFLTEDDLIKLEDMIKESHYKVMYARFNSFSEHIFNSGLEIIDSENNESNFDLYLVDYQTTTSFKSSTTSEVMIITLIAQCLRTYI